MTTEIPELMEKRRNNKNKNMEKYRERHSLIKKKINEAKEKYMIEKCKEIEALEASHDVFNMYKKIREITGTGKRKQYSVLRGKDYIIILIIKQKMKRWGEYVKESFKDHRTEELTKVIATDGVQITK